MIWMPNNKALSPIREEEGQSTLEYLIVLLGLIAMIVALYALVRTATSGVLGRLAQESASHAISGDGLLDALLF